MLLWYIYRLFDSKNIINTWFLNASHWPPIGQAGSIYTAGKTAQINPAPSARLSRFGSSPSCITFTLFLSWGIIWGVIVFWTYALQRLINCCYGVIDRLATYLNRRSSFLRIIVSSKFWRGVSGFYILLPGGSYLTHSISIWYQV